MARIPKPSRTKRGMGAGAKLALGIDYYVAADGVGPDHGFLHGKDDYGPWELAFEGTGEFNAVVEQVVASLREVATAAREEGDGRNGDLTVWLKAIGAKGWPIDEVWWEQRERGDGVDFPYRPKSILPDDLLVLYAAGLGVLVGVGRVDGKWFRGDKHPRWPWRVNMELLAKVPASRGVPLDVLAIERAIGKSIRQKSHIRLSEAEAAKAMEEFGLEG